MASTTTSLAGSTDMLAGSPTAPTARELSAWRGFLRAHAALHKALDAELEARHGLPLTSFEVLGYLAEASDQRMRMCDLASSILLSRSGLTRLVDRLERDGLIVRATCSSDARGSYAVLTPAGRRRLEEARPTHLAGVRALFLRYFTPAELDALADAWQRVLPGAAEAAGCGCGLP